MARTVYSDEERNRRIELVGGYRLKTGDTTRNIARYFTENEFSISYVTVFDYIKRYVKKHPEFSKIIGEQTRINTPDSIKKEEVKERTLEVAKLVKEGFTLEEISNSLGEPYWVIHGDIKLRLPLLDKELAKELDKILDDRRKSNLKNRI